MDTTKSSQTSTSAKDSTTRRRTNVRRVQNVALIWLDNSTDRDSEDYQNTMTQLQCVVNTIEIFTDDVQCIDFLKHVTDEKVIMIISDALCQNTLPLIHNIVQIHAIFIFYRNEKQYESWAQKWPKIRGIFTEIQPICKVIKGVAQQCEQNAISISFVPISGDLSNKRLDQLDCSFMYTQILKEILFTIVFQQQHIKEFIDYCYEQFAGNAHEFNKVKQFEQKYHDKTPIWWYTWECFLYSMLNRALRLMDVDIIIKMGFFIGDLHRHIEKLHSEQFGEHRISETLTLYRGQGLRKTDFDQMMNTKDGLISFNNFLSTSKDRDVSFTFAESNTGNPDLVGTLFVITVDPLISSTPFASIKDISYYNEENEILFSMHTVFRICDIKPIGEVDRLYQVNLTLTNDNDQDLRMLTDRIREETFPNSIGWNRLGQLLIKLGQFEKAQQVYEVLFGQSTNENDKAHIYVQLGKAKNHLGQYDEAIACYEKSLEIYKKILPSNHPDLGIVYSNISNVYCNMGEYSKALWSDEKALEIRQQSLPSNHPDLALSYNNIGNVYDGMGEYQKALWAYQKALEIRQQSLPGNHPDLALSYNNIGNVYDDMCEYQKALWSYEKALEIRQQSLPGNHPDVAASYNNIGLAYDNMNEYAKALWSHEKAVEIKQQ